MATKSNVFTSPYRHYLQSLTDINHLSYFTEVTAKSTRSRLERRVAQSGPDDMFLGTALSIVDVFHSGEYITRRAGGSHMSKTADLLGLLDEHEHRAYALALVQVHEEFERLVKAFFGKMLYQLRGRSTVANKKQFHSSFPRIAKVEGTVPYFEQYATWSCRRNCEPAFAQFTKHLNWRRMHLNLFYDMNWIEFSETIAFCRHRIVHANLIEPGNLNSLSPAAKSLIQPFIRKGTLTKQDAILPDKKQLKSIIEVLASIGRGVYHLLSEKAHMHINPDE